MNRLRWKFLKKRYTLELTTYMMNKFDDLEPHDQQLMQTLDNRFGRGDTGWVTSMMIDKMENRIRNKTEGRDETMNIDQINEVIDESFQEALVELRDEYSGAR